LGRLAATLQFRKGPQDVCELPICHGPRIARPWSISLEIHALRIAALIVAAGRGTRAAVSGAGPKQYALIGGAPVLWHTLRAFAGNSAISDIQVVIHHDDAEFYRESVPVGAATVWPAVIGGATRQASVYAGLQALSALKPDAVLIHDAARPFVGPETIKRAIEALITSPAVIAALPVADTLKRANPDGTIAGTLDRSSLWYAQTPQGFHFDVILDAHRRAAETDRDDFTDDAAIAEWAGIPVKLIEGTADNVKLTTAADIAEADRKLSGRSDRDFEPRVGTGFDVHRFTVGDHIWLGGISIGHTHGLEGHSDADVVLHALTDALLGTIGDGDIGQHFPPSDPKWKDAASRLFLEDAALRVRTLGGRIGNVDITVLAEAPRIGPHRAAMQALIGDVLGLAPDRVGIKATTMESMGFVGRREGIAAMASATVFLPRGGN
jgi:2-C-methyl-D-erythritol 4-phosphate cytidylyltransferase / 2-C-methyl-D-erythritol 2,4-cyclodiphosphate synthase